MCVSLQVLHLVGMALLEEQQQLENSSGDDVTFNYTCKITRQYRHTKKHICASSCFTNTNILGEEPVSVFRCLNFSALSLTPDIRMCLPACSGPGEAPSTSGSVLALLESLQNAPHLEVHKDMITWILKVNSGHVLDSHCSSLFFRPSPFF